MKTISDMLGNRIRQYRTQRNFTQEMLSFNSGVNLSYLSEIERGIKKPSVETLEKLLKALDVTFLKFFAFEANMESNNSGMALEKLNQELQNRSDNEIEMIYSIVRQVLVFKDGHLDELGYKSKLCIDHTKPNEGD